MKHADSRIKQLMSREAEHQDTIIIVTQGLTHREESQIRALVKSLVRKRSHEKRPRLLYNITSGN